MHKKENTNMRDNQTRQKSIPFVKKKKKIKAIISNSLHLISNQFFKKLNAGDKAGITCSETLLQTMQILSLLRKHLGNTHQKC